VVFGKPGKMSWTYGDSGNRVVSDGKTLKVYEKENGQLFEQPVEKSQYPAALSFLMGQGDLTKAFNLKLLDPATHKFEGGYVLEGVPKGATSAYQKVLFYVDAETSQVRRAVILDAQGNRNDFTFDKPTVNNELAKDAFDFTPPDGTQVVRP
jgi:outer membrane lipoprotein carrier protein